MSPTQTQNIKGGITAEQSGKDSEVTGDRENVTAASSTEEDVREKTARAGSVAGIETRAGEGLSAPPLPREEEEEEESRVLDQGR